MERRQIVAGVSWILASTGQGVLTYSEEDATDAIYIDVAYGPRTVSRSEGKMDVHMLWAEYIN